MKRTVGADFTALDKYFPFFGYSKLNIDLVTIRIRLCCLLHRCKNCGVLFVVFFFLLLEAVALDRKCCDRASESGWCVFAFFYMGLNHYIGSLLNYRLLFLSQRHHAIFEALLCSSVWLLPLFFLADVPVMYCICRRQYTL